MKNIYKMLAAAAIALPMATSCIEEIDPQSTTVTAQQAANAPGSFDNFVNAITNTMIGSHRYVARSSNDYPWDYGYPTFFLMRDVMGQDIAIGNGNNWYTTWAQCGTSLGPGYAYCQVPWRLYYAWIKNCNNVISLAKAAEFPEEMQAGAGIAYAMRAFYYMDLARMYAVKPYTADKNAETVPIISEESLLENASNNPRATNEDMWNFIISDLDNAEKYIANYKRADKYTPDLSVVKGLKARAYLTMGEWKKAQEYARDVKQNYNYSVMSESQYLSQTSGFNTPNDSWMFGLTFKPDDECITANDTDSSWGSWMIIECTGSGCGYAGSYGAPMYIDRHLYETMPETDFRKKSFIDFAIDEMETEDEMVEALGNYSDDPEGLLITADAADGVVGGLSVKFRPKDGDHNNQYNAFCVAVPLMRVEEMWLIDAEATGMLNEQEGVTLLTEFAQKRDPEYVYGTHEDHYYASLSTFQREIWYQRRAEFWGEGMATFDIKRFQAGIIRSYPNTNHPVGARWNVTTTPDWMNLCIVETEVNNNYACTNNPIPVKPSADSDEVDTW